MTNQQRALKEMILEGMYVVDERSVAGAIVARATVRTAVARTSFHSDTPRRELQRPAFGSYTEASSSRLEDRRPH